MKRSQAMISMPSRDNYFFVANSIVNSLSGIYLKIIPAKSLKVDLLRFTFIVFF